MHTSTPIAVTATNQKTANFVIYMPMRQYVNPMLSRSEDKLLRMRLLAFIRINNFVIVSKSFRFLDKMYGIHSDLLDEKNR